ncbi:VOC family protein [Planomicrobium sp. MB-3u-38]|uniref:VOC family protein n=1 Tax=Planomicrobium sp. MB-3u-38 TaxID=2058318 RepID=UPI000C7AB72C|nr:VOC family protein [Planomicrobium sp. MB-3u-38]PKH08564.1 bleomycin resistance protein [Planomicrobium sp. MB-3u-38]
MELTHIRLLVDNYKECFLFYRNVLGFNVVWGDEASNYADFEFAGVKLGLFERKQMADAIGAEYHLLRKRSDKAALIFKVDDVEETYRELQKKVDFITEPTVQEDWGIKVAHFRDPAGNLLEIYESLESMGD